MTIFGIKIFISVCTLFLVVFSVFIVNTIFLDSWQTEYEILLMSKPFKKSTLFIIKFLFLFFLIFVLSFLTFVLAIPTKFQIYDYYQPSSTIWIGAFLGTIINCLFWSSLSLILGLWIKKNGAIICVFAIKAMLLFISFTCLFTNVSLSHLQNKEKLIAKSVGLVSKIDANNQMTYHWGAISINHNWKPIDLNNVKVNNIPLKFQIKNHNEFNNFYWNELNKKTNSKILNIIDLDYQLASLYTYYTNKDLNKLNGSLILNLLMWEEVLSKSFIPEFVTINLEELVNKIDVADLKIKSDLFYLTLNPNLLIEWNNGKNRIGSNLFFKQINGQNKIDWNLDSLTLPILEINETNSNWKTQEFNDIQSFAKYYYSNSFISNKHQFEVYLKRKAIGPYKNWTFSIYWTLFSSYLAQINNVNLKSNSFKIQSWLNDLYKTIFSFQYWTYLFIDDLLQQPQKYSWLDFLGLQTALSNLNYFTYVRDNEITSKFAWLTYMDKASNLINTIKQNNLVIDQNSAFKSLQTPFSLMPKKSLETFSLVNIKTTLNLNNVLISWLLVSLLMIVLSGFIYTKKDVK